MSKTGQVFSAKKDTDILEDYSVLPDGVDVFEISGPFFFAAAKQYNEVLQDIHASSKSVIIRMRHVPFIDATGIKNFKELITMMKAKKVDIILSGVRKDVKNDLNKAGIIELLGKENIFSSFEEAVNAVKK
ncbi:MAG: sodium-independent anion transporter [Marinifilaceae bacterium]